MELKIDVNGVGKRVGARGGESGRIAGVRSDTGGNLYLTLGTSTAKRDRSMVFDGDDCHRGKRGERGHRLTCRAELARGGPPGERGLSVDRGLEKAPFH